MSNEVSNINDPKTKGKIVAFGEVLKDVEERQKGLPERIAFNDGARKAIADAIKFINDYIALMIKTDRKKVVDTEITKKKRDLILDVKKNIEKLGQEFLQESLMIKGEARSLVVQLKSIEKLYKKALIDEQSKNTFQKQQDEIHQQREEMMKPVEKNEEETGDVVDNDNIEKQEEEIEEQEEDVEEETDDS